jgi:short-chain fatty acids transporter
MFKKLTNACVVLVQKLLPDAFIFCIVLSIIVFVLAMPLTGQGPMALVMHWGSGVWSLLAFSMQMALVLVLGSAMANSPPMQKLLRALALIPKTPAGSILLVSFVSFICFWLNWGFGLVVGAIFAKEIAKVKKNVDYRLLIASAYTSIVIWHGGTSGSIPLMIANVTEAVTKATGGALTSSVPVTATIFAPWNLLCCLAITLIVPFVNVAMHPKPDKVVSIDPSLLSDDVAEKKIPKTPAERLEQSRILLWITVILGVTFIALTFARRGVAALDLNLVNLIFLVLGLILHETPLNYVKAISKSASGAAGVLLQFPFYAGIMGMMTGVSAATGLTFAGVISTAFVSISNPVTFPLFSYLSAGIVNFFVPSGGGQWAVQAPIMMPAGAELGVSPAVTAMTIAWGDAWTNLIQPFWALPALAIAKLGARDIMGYCVVNVIVVGVITAIMFILVGIL